MKLRISQAKKLLALFYVVNLGLFLFHGCSPENKSKAPAMKKMTVLTTIPADTSSSVGLDATVTATFSEDTEKSTISAATFVLNNGVTGAVAYSGKTATFTPTIKLSPDTTYKATITSWNKDSAGNLIPDIYSWSFKTSFLDTLPPTIYSITPGINAINIPISSPINVTFSEAMDKSSLNASTFIIDNDVTGTIGLNGNMAIFTPTANFSPNTTYTVTLTSGIKDSAGNALVANYSWAFTTGAADSATITDSDGNSYNAVSIGTQVWMKENLKTTKYRNGDTIGTTSPATQDIGHDQSLKYQWAYNGDESKVSTYGRLYSGPVITDDRGLCPISWHIPTKNDWKTLAEYLGGYRVAGKKMKASESSEWAGLLGGIRDNYYGFLHFGIFGMWWSFDPLAIDKIDVVWLYSSDSLLTRENSITDKGGTDGLSARCLKDGDNAASLTILPTVLSTSPANNETYILVNSQITATLNSDVDISTITNDTFKIDKGITGTITSSEGRVIFTPSANLSPYTTYTATIDTGVKNSKGNAMASMYTWTFTTGSADSATDMDGNTYGVVTIGTQVWMKENLKTTKYRNGDPIPTTPERFDISKEESPKYQWDGSIYGRYYTWYAATDVRGICPSGWHVPSSYEWKTLATFLGGYDVAWKKMKESGTAHWDSPNTAADNSSGFTALPGGLRESYGYFGEIGSSSYWWSMEAYSFTSPTRAGVIEIRNSINELDENSEDKKSGLTVRCIRD